MTDLIDKPTPDNGSLLTVLAAILARSAGEYDHPALVAYGPLTTDTLDDIQDIANAGWAVAEGNLTVWQLSLALRHHPVAMAIMQAGDVLSEFGIGEGEVDESEEEYQARFKAAQEWLAENRKHIEEAMVRAGLEAISLLGDAPQRWKIGPFPA